MKNLTDRLWLTLLFMFMPLLAIAGQPTGVGYNTDVSPAIQVIDSTTGPAKVAGTFKLFNGSAASNALGAGDFTVKVDGVVTPAVITPPASGTGQKMADIVFLMDISGSMGSEIVAVKNNTQSFVNALNAQNFDVRLGLITFGARPAPYLKVRNNGQFYASTAAFINEFSGLSVSGGIEEWFDASVLGSQFPFRAGADRILILITDEPGDNKNYTVNTAIPVVKANATTVYGISYPSLANVVNMVNQTGGRLYPINSNFNDILNSIAAQIANNYGVSLLTNAGAGLHYLHVAPTLNDPAGEDKEPFKIGANPVVTLSQATQDLIANGVATGTSNIPIAASITDPDGSVAQANIIWQVGTSLLAKDPMTGSGSNYTYTYAGAIANNACFAFSIQAIDNEGRNTTVPANSGNTVGGMWRICAANKAPVVGTIAPLTYDYNTAITLQADVTDDQALSGLTVMLRYAQSGSLSVLKTLPMTLNNGSFFATIPAADASFNGLDVTVVAQDANNGTGQGNATLTPKAIPVTIIDVTRYIDTLDTGPFSVHAVVAGLDINKGGQVNLMYSVNGTAGTPLAMIQSVTGTSALMPANSNIYVEKIPAVKAGDKVCYHVEASNPTTTAKSTETCFNVLQPVAPLAVKPDQVLMAVGDADVEFLATGGHTGGYKWSALNGTLSTQLGDTTKYKATIAGKDRIDLTDIKGFTAVAFVEVLPALAISPDVNGARFSPSSTVQLTATGAEPPYQWKVDNATSATAGNDNENVAITLGADPATVKATVTDSKGRTTSVSFTNNGQLKIDPAGPEVNVAPSSETTIKVTGGSGSYQWTTIGGDVDNPTAATVKYKAPAVPGVYHISVKDGNDSASLVMKVGTELRVTPNRARVGQGQAVDFTVVSGTAPYLWEADFGALSATSGDKISYTPESHLGMYEVRVFDAAGSVKKLYVTVSDGLAVSPASATVDAKGTVELKVVGGSGDYTWSASQGSVAPLTGDTVTYTAPASVGTAIVTVKDKAGNNATVNITIIGTGDLGISVTPSAMALQVGQSRELTAKGGAGDYSWQAEQGTVAPNSGDKVSYTAPNQAGTDKITVTDKQGNSKVVTVYVTSAIGEMSITPSSVNLAQGGKQTFVVNNATSVKWSASGGAVTDGGEYTAPASNGKYIVSATDYKTGRTVSANVVVSSAQLTLSPTQATVKTNASTNFSVSGGEAPYTWLLEGEGNLTDTGDKATFTAGIHSGIATVRVTDNKGLSGKAEVTIKGDSVLLTPEVAWLDLNGTETFTVVGGVAPFTWKASAGKITADGVYTAPSASTDVSITVTDGAGKEGYAKVYVDLPLMPTREAIYLGPEETAKVAVVGGLPPFEWQAKTGEMREIRTDDAGYNYYTAPKEMGDTQITVRDRKGNTTTIKVNVVQPLAVTPLVRYLKKGEKTTFTVVTAGGYITAVAEKGDIVADNPAPDNNEDTGLVVSKDGKFSYTAPNVADQDVGITFTDQRGQPTKVHAYVERQLRVSPTTLFVDKDGKIDFTVVGGTGDSIITAEQGQTSKIDEETGKGTYTAPKVYGTYTLTLSDSSDQEITFKAEVARVSPQISPAVANVVPGGTQVFMVTRGSGEYVWGFEGGLFRPLNDQGTMVEITAPATGGSYKLSAEDKAGNIATAVVTVAQSLMISPTSYSVYKGENVAVRFNKLGGTGKCDWILDGITEVTKGDDFLVIRPRTDVDMGTTYTVGCRDQVGDQAQASVTVTSLPADMDGDGKINDTEAEAGIDAYFGEKPLNGVSIDKTNLYDIVELYSQQ